jgi:hypothetical protein
MKLSKTYGLTHNKIKHTSILEQFGAIEKDLANNKI